MKHPYILNIYQKFGVFEYPQLESNAKVTQKTSEITSIPYDKKRQNVFYEYNPWKFSGGFISLLGGNLLIPQILGILYKFYLKIF